MGRAVKVGALGIGTAIRCCDSRRCCGPCGDSRLFAVGVVMVGGVAVGGVADGSVAVGVVAVGAVAEGRVAVWSM